MIRNETCPFSKGILVILEFSSSLNNIFSPECISEKVNNTKYFEYLFIHYLASQKTFNATNTMTEIQRSVKYFEHALTPLKVHKLELCSPIDVL